MPKTTFIIYDESYLIRKGLISIIEKIPNTVISYQADNKDELLDILEKKDPDFIIININLLQNKNIITEINKKSNNSQFIALSGDPSYESNELNWAEIIYLNDSQNKILKKLSQLISNKPGNNLKTEIPEEISKREVDILKYIALGYSNKEIAEKLFISAHTVITHRKNITRKLGIKTVPGLTIYAILNKIIDINDTTGS